MVTISKNKIAASVAGLLALTGFIFATTLPNDTELATRIIAANSEAEARDIAGNEGLDVLTCKVYFEHAECWAETTTTTTSSTTTTTPVTTTTQAASGWPRNLAANPTGPKKALPAATSSFSTTANGQVIDGLNVNGVIQIKHDNVTIRNFKVRGVNNLNGDKLTLEDGIIDGIKQVENGFNDGGITLRRVEITGTKEGGKALGNTLVEDCYIHDLYYDGVVHTDGFQMSGGSNNTFRRNRFESKPPGQQGTAAIFAKPDFGAITNVLVEGNYFNYWGNYMVQADPKGTVYPSGLTYKDNIFGATATYVPWAGTHRINAKNVVWTNNRREDGTVVPL